MSSCVAAAAGPAARVEIRAPARVARAKRRMDMVQLLENRLLVFFRWLLSWARGQ
ncbi:hypothetical protein D3C76_1310420 [compost metagenome]